MKTEEMAAIFTPDNEPYLGREPLFVLDTLITASLEENSKAAPRSHQLPQSDCQSMASQVIPQAMSIALSIRELIRQGYLFGGHVLVRSLAERVAILLYLHHHPDKIDVWNRGWSNREAPSLAKMFEALHAKNGGDPKFKGGELTASMNSLVHGKPDSAPWSIIPLGADEIGHAPSKILNRGDLCDDLCSNTIPWLVIVPAMMAAYFPDEGAM